MKALLIVFCIVLLKLSIVSLDLETKKDSSSDHIKRLLSKDKKYYHGQDPKNSYLSKNPKRDVLKDAVERSDNKHKSLLLDLASNLEENKPGKCPNPNTNEYSFVCGLYQCKSDKTCYGAEKCVSLNILFFVLFKNSLEFVKLFVSIFISLLKICD